MNGGGFAENLRKNQVITTLGLLFIAIVSGILNFDGATFMMASDGLTGRDQFIAAIVAAAVSVMIFLFWRYAMDTVLSVDTLQDKLISMVVTVVGCLVIACVSAWLNVMALVGGASMTLEMDEVVAELDSVFAETYEASAGIIKLEPPIDQARIRYYRLAERELCCGELTGSPGPGEVVNTLQDTGFRMSTHIEAIHKSREQTETLALQGRAILQDLRRAAGNEAPFGERYDALVREATKLRGVITRMQSADGTLEAIKQDMISLANTVIAEPRGNGSSRLRTAQRKALADLRADFTRTGVIVTGIAEDLQEGISTEVPTIKRQSPASLVWKHAGSYVPFWAAGIGLDWLPTLLIFYLMLQKGHSDRVARMMGQYGVPANPQIAGPTSAQEPQGLIGPQSSHHGPSPIFDKPESGPLNPDLSTDSWSEYRDRN